MNWSTPSEMPGGSRPRMPRGARLTEGAIAKKLVFTALTVSLLVATVGMGTWAAFSATTVNTGNSFSTGSMTLTDNDSGSALLALSNAGPGATDTGCLQVTYSSDVGNAGVRLFGTVTGDLDPYLTVVVTRSELAGTCAAMGATTEVFNGTLDTFAADYATGVGGGVQWATGDTYAYHFSVTLSNDTAAQGKSATADFTWEARTL